MTINPLSTPLQAGALTLQNRIVMAPLTRCKAGEDRVPTSMMARYYKQRAGAGLILTEATSVSPMGVGYPNTPGIWSDAQVEAWKTITDAVHERGGLIVMQLWHVGRISHSRYLEGALPVAPSSIAAEGHVSHIRPITPFETPRALETDEIPGIVAAYRLGAENAKQAGFDGVELHAANGYLIDQFLQDRSNKRTDPYGGNIENRARLLLEVVDALISVYGANRIGVHLAPRGDAHSMGDSNPLATFTYVARALGRRNIAFLFIRESIAKDSISPTLKEAFGGVLIANENFTPALALEQVSSGAADAVSFGKYYISNPDLAERILSGAPLTPFNPDTFYGPGEAGYTDFPTMTEQ